MAEEIRKKIVKVSKLMYEKGMVNAFEGNVSILDNGKVYITPSAVCKGFLTEDMIVVTDMDGNVLKGDHMPSSEIKMHLAAYRYRHDIKSVVHAHSPYATAYALANRPIETRAYPEMIVLFDRIPLVPYGTPSTDEIYCGFEGLLKDHDIVLLANHGIMAIGRDVYDAFFKLESAESMARVLMLAKQLGGERELPEDKLEQLYEIRRKRG
ncbi:MAG: class II aldolase/adducin family protein [Acetivibrionales bacterium]